MAPKLPNPAVLYEIGAEVVPCGTTAPVYIITADEAAAGGGERERDGRSGVRAAGGTPMEFNTIAISDGITMGTEGMSYSLPSRDLIADSIEMVMGAQWYDALITVPGCDKNMPGSLMAMARLNVPACGQAI